MALPKTMRAIVLNQKNLSVRNDIELPPLKQGEVLIKVHYSPINPSDLLFSQGIYQTDKPDPCVPGFEGSGIVIESGGGLLGWSLKGKRVGFTTLKSDFYGAWGEYIVCPALAVVTLPPEVSLENGCNCIVNPLSALMMLETLQEGNHKAVISTAAASQLGRMMQRLFSSNGISVINIVRRQEQVDILKNEEHAEYVLNSSDQDFLQKLKDLSLKLQPTAAFDAIGGAQVAQLVKFLQPGGIYYIYGALDLNNVQVSGADLLFNRITLSGWWLVPLFGKKTVWGKLSTMNKLSKLLATQLSTKISKIFKMEEFAQAFESYKSNMSDGKVILKINNEEN